MRRAGYKELDVKKLNYLMKSLVPSWAENQPSRPGSNFIKNPLCVKLYGLNRRACDQGALGLMCFNYCTSKGAYIWRYGR